MEHTLLVIKPHAVEAGASLRIMQAVESQGLSIRHICQRMMNEEEAAKLHASMEHCEHYQGAVASMISNPVVMLVLEGPDAAPVLHSLCGHMDPAKASAGTLRADFGVDLNCNAVYAPDSPEKAKRDISILFPGLILATFERRAEIIPAMARAV